MFYYETYCWSYLIMWGRVAPKVFLNKFGKTNRAFRAATVRKRNPYVHVNCRLSVLSLPLPNGVAARILFSDLIRNYLTAEKLLSASSCP